MTSTFGPADWRTSTNADCAPAPILETIWNATSVVEELVSNASTIESPNAEPTADTARSGAMAPLKTSSDALLALPPCSCRCRAGSISYQRTIEPAPPAIVCWVQIAADPIVGSIAGTACVSRPSIVSSTAVVPFCSAGGGSEYVNTVTDVAVPAMFAVPSAFVVTEKSERVRRVLPVRSLAAMTHPLELVSVSLTGTGVKAFVPSAFLSVWC